MSINRRQFVKRSTVAAAGLALPMAASGSVLGANDEIRVAVVGLGRSRRRRPSAANGTSGGRASCRHLRSRPHSARPPCQVDGEQVQTPGREVRRRPQADGQERHRRSDSVATMNYWHALPTIWACQTGRHVYCEKAAFPLHSGRAADGRRGPQVRPPGPGRHAIPFDP